MAHLAFWVLHISGAYCTSVDQRAQTLSLRVPWVLSAPGASEIKYWNSGAYEVQGPTESKEI